MRLPQAMAVVLVAGFIAGFGSHLLYQRWSSLPEDALENSAETVADKSQAVMAGSQGYRVTYVPLATAIDEKPADLPLLQARDVEKIRGLTGNQARIRGRVFRVGHSAKSNTYFLNFGPSREALTAVIFASAAEVFEKNKLSPKSFDGREVELQGEVKNHPQYGLEVILESPSQIKIIN
jgi:DNA/RNA endonuclease YhcR with UshA esterase domain